MLHDAERAALLFAIDPLGCGGAVLRGPSSPARERWLALLRALLPGSAPWRRMPLHTDEARLLGGIDLPATLAANRMVMQPGLLAQCDGGVLLLASAERLSPGRAARLGAVLDTQAVSAPRDAVAAAHPARLGLVALDEGRDDDEHVPDLLRDRLAFWIGDLQEPAHDDDLEDGDIADPDIADIADGDASAVLAARERLASVSTSHDIVHALCAAAQVLAIPSLRAPWLALRVARAAAAWDGRDEVNAEDAALAARLVLAPRARAAPTQAAEPEDAPPQPPPDNEDAAEPSPPDEPDPSPQEQADSPPQEQADTSPDAQPALDDVVLEAALAALPPGLLASIAQSTGAAGPRTGAGGRTGAARSGQARGRPIGARRGQPGSGARLALVDTLRAAAPWQGVRRRAQETSQANAGPPQVGLTSAGGGAAAARPSRLSRHASTATLQVRREDLHVQRRQERSETTTVFVVDASGSAALHRLAEAKGAVQLLLADCYVRRDRVALLVFRGRGAELLLPPTRSLAAARRRLAGMPGGGGTPLAAAIDAAVELADGIRRRGDVAQIVFLSDGRANIARNGAPGRETAQHDAVHAARRLRAAGHAALWLDTSPAPQGSAQAVADAMRARYLPLPHAQAHRVSEVVRGLSAPARRS